MAGLEPATAEPPARCATNCATSRCRRSRRAPPLRHTSLRAHASILSVTRAPLDPGEYLEAVWRQAQTIPRIENHPTVNQFLNDLGGVGLGEAVGQSHMGRRNDLVGPPYSSALHRISCMTRTSRLSNAAA